MSVELKEPQLLTRLEHWAHERTESVEHVLEMAARHYLDTLDAAAIHAETEAFWAMHAELLAQYPGQHVALYQGEVVDHDTDVRRLEARIRTRYGATPVLIAPVSAPRELQWRGGRFAASGVA